jgi:hypothetical protein
MAVASLILAIAALVIALASAVFTRQQASAAAESLSIERRRRHEERRPRLSGEVVSTDGGQSYRLQITLDADSCPLTRMEVAIRNGHGVAFRRGFANVLPVISSAEIPLRASIPSGNQEPMGLLPGGTAQWPVDVAHNHDPAVWIDATCYAEGKGEGEDHWTVPVEAQVAAALPAP